MGKTPIRSMTRFTTSSFLLLVCLLLVTNLGVGAATTQSERHCIKASKAACVWVSRPWGHTASAHVVTPCQDEDSRCVFSSTCHVNDVPRDIFHCQDKDGEQNHPKTSRTERRKRKYGKPEAMLSHVHKRQRRSTEDEEDATTETPEGSKEQVPSKGNTLKVPSFFSQIMAKHRSYNAAAFKRGTFIINPISHRQRESVKIQPVRSKANSSATESKT